MSAPSLKFSRFPTAVDLHGTSHTDIALVAAVAAKRGARRDGATVISNVSALATTVSGNANHCWRSVRNWANTALRDVVQVTKNPDGSSRFDLIGGTFIKFPTWAISSGALSRVGIVALLGLCAGLKHSAPTSPVSMTRRSLHNRTGLNNRTISKALDELEAAGVITKRHRFDSQGRRIATAYTINWTPPARHRTKASARHRTKASARHRTKASARHRTNISEDLHSEDLHSDPPAPQSELDTEISQPSTGGNSSQHTTTTDRCDALLFALEQKRGIWAPLLARARVTQRHRRRIAAALHEVPVELAADRLEELTTTYSMLGVRSAIAVLPSRLDEVVRTIQTEQDVPALNPRQVLLRTMIHGELCAGIRKGTIADWQYLIDEAN